MIEHTLQRKILALCGLILIVLLLVTPVAAKILPTSVFTVKPSTGVHQYMKNFGYGASSIQEMRPFLPAIKSLNLTPAPTPSDHPIPEPGALIFNRNLNLEEWV
ncbi:MAG: hypothetical protein LUQ01_01095 [Methanolinea sp.]|nr:hypothetical protein [Methanolinea sp.]